MIAQQKVKGTLWMRNNQLFQPGDTRVDEQTAAKMRLLIDEIQLALARSTPSSDSSSSPPTLTERVKELISDFEVHHPKLTANLSLIAERLADMGI